MIQQPYPSLLAADPRYIIGDDGRSILLCDGDRIIATMLSGLGHNDAESVCLHLNLATHLGALRGIKEAGKITQEAIDHSPNTNQEGSHANS